jgi:hypothetical protein
VQIEHLWEMCDAWPRAWIKSSRAEMCRFDWNSSGRASGGDLSNNDSNGIFEMIATLDKSQSWTHQSSPVVTRWVSAGGISAIPSNSDSPRCRDVLNDCFRPRQQSWILTLSELPTQSSRGNLWSHGCLWVPIRVPPNQRDSDQSSRCTRAIRRKPSTAFP